MIGLMADYSYSRKLIRPAFVRFDLVHGGRVTQVSIEHEPEQGKPWRAVVERPGKPPRQVRITVPADITTTSVRMLRLRYAINSEWNQSVRKTSGGTVLSPCCHRC